MSDDSVTAEQLLRGVNFSVALPDGWTPIEAIVLIKCIDDRGEPTWAYRTSGNMNDEELLGALTVRRDLLRKQLLHEFIESDDDEI